MKKFYSIILLVGFAVFVIFGCSKSGDVKDKPESTTCPEKITMKVASKNGGYPAEPIDWSNIKCAKAIWNFAGLGGDSKALTVYLSNAEFSFDQLKSQSSIELPAGQGIVTLIFANGQKNASVGVYKTTPNYADPFSVIAGIYVKGRVTVQFDSYKTTGTAEITELTADKACGKFSLKDNWSDISGSFSAEIAK
jgi:hypothetical protein